MYLETDNEFLAKKAYNAYGEFRDWKTFDGRKMPTWEDLGEEIQQAWTKAAEAIVKELTFFST